MSRSTVSIRKELAPYQVQVEATRPSSGKADVLTTKGLESIPIAIETGKSELIGNLARNEEANLKIIIMIATNEVAFQTIRRRLKIYKCQSRIETILPS